MEAGFGPDYQGISDIWQSASCIDPSILNTENLDTYIRATVQLSERLAQDLFQGPLKARASRHPSYAAVETVYSASGSATD